MILELVRDEEALCNSELRAIVEESTPLGRDGFGVSGVFFEHRLRIGDVLTVEKGVVLHGPLY